MALMAKDEAETGSVPAQKAVLSAAKARGGKMVVSLGGQPKTRICRRRPLKR